MKIIGLTGSIGAGKSTAAGLLRSLGIPVFDSDAYVHDLLANDPEVIARIIEQFPSSRDGEGYKIDRKALGKIVFYNYEARKRLEGILHPKIWESQRGFIAAARRAGHKKVVLDIPLLYETERDRLCDAVFCVTVPHFIQRQRVLSRKGMDESKFSAILRGQLPSRHKEKLADYIIPTGLGRAYTLQHLKNALRSIK